jgi:ABC-2 type transport system permease protein
VNDRRGLFLVAGRELREAVRRRTFWIVVALVLAASTAAVVVPEALDEGPTSYDVAVVGGSADLSAQLEAVAESLDVELDLSEAADVSAATRLVADDDVDLAIVVGDEPVVVAKEGRAVDFVAAAQQLVGLQALIARLGGAGLSPAEVQDALQASQPRVVSLEEEDASRRGSAAIVALVLYLLLIMLMSQVATGTAIEKANRIAEVLLAVVRPGSLLFGKVLGVALVGLLTLGIGLVPPLVGLATGGDLPPGLGTAIVAGAPWFLLGLVLYLTIAGALGALVERQEEASSVVTPLTILLIASFLVAQTASDTPLGKALAIFPLTSPIVMPSRIAVGEATVPEMVVSLALGVATVVLVLRMGARVYARAIVRTGRRLKVREVLA